jgi:GDPmannose 4,6-dehydratase
VIATGEQHSVRDFVNEAAPYFGFNIKWYGEGIYEAGYDDEVKSTPIIRVNPIYFRPTEVDTLLGNPAKAMRVLGWKPKYTFKQLVEEMCIHGQ